MLRKVKINNFKSFKNFKLEQLDKFNVIMAPNNTGKSNLIEAFRFLKYAVVDVKKAIEEFGGFDNIKNIFLEEKIIKFECEFFKEKILSVGLRNKYINEVINGKRKTPASEEYIEVFKNIYIKLELEIFENGHWIKHYYIKGRFGKRSNNLPLEDFNIFSKTFDQEAQKIKTYPFEIKVSYTTDFEKNEEHQSLLKLRNEIIKKELVFIDAKDKENLLYALGLNSLIEKNYSVFSGNSNLLKLDDYFYAYSFYPEIIKSSFKGGKFLRFDGTNLVEVLKFILDILPENFEIISNSLIGIVEELNDIEIGKDLIDRNILLLKEKDKLLPFNITSDGTINLLTLLTAVFEPIQKEMLIFDEIEKHLHLKAIDYILEVLKEQKFQVIFTTQSIEILNNLNLKKDNLIFLYRDDEGFTKAINTKKIPNFNKKIKRYKDITTIIRNEVLGYLGDFDEN